MQSIEALLRERGVRVLVVSFTPVPLMKAFLAEHPLAFPIVSDPNREAYRVFELGRASIFSFFRPSVLAKFIRQMFGGYRVRKPVDRDVLQLGGDFLFDANGRLAWKWASKDPTDRPTAEDLRAAIVELPRIS